MKIRDVVGYVTFGLIIAVGTVGLLTLAAYQLMIEECEDAGGHVEGRDCVIEFHEKKGITENGK